VKQRLVRMIIYEAFDVQCLSIMMPSDFSLANVWARISKPSFSGFGTPPYSVTPAFSSFVLIMVVVRHRLILPVPCHSFNNSSRAHRATSTRHISGSSLSIFLNLKSRNSIKIFERNFYRYIMYPLFLNVEDCYIRHKKSFYIIRKRRVEAEEKEFSENQFPTFPSLIILRHPCLGI
jgi:hypothetical protein